MSRSVGDLLLAVLIEIPSSESALVLTYEDAVLPLLSKHGGRLERRLRAEDGTAEWQLIRFESRTAWDSYTNDPSRLQLQRLLQGHVLRQRVLHVSDVSERSTEV
jgi:hypothetical protein